MDLRKRRDRNASNMSLKFEGEKFIKNVFVDPPHFTTCLWNIQMDSHHFNFKYKF